jgi:hypothetical protein
MKAAPTTSTYTVAFARRSAPRPTVAPVGRVPRVARLLALAHRIEAMVRTGELKDRADAARTLGLTRARVTQVMNLLLLAPSIQESILELSAVTSGPDPVTERSLRGIVAEPDWGRQLQLWRVRDDHPQERDDAGR